MANDDDFIKSLRFIVLFVLQYKIKHLLTNNKVKTCFNLNLISQTTHE